MTYAVKAYRGIKGWQILKFFDSPAKAEAWLFEYIKKGGYSITDFTIKAIED